MSGIAHLNNPGETRLPPDMGVAVAWCLFAPKIYHFPRMIGILLLADRTKQQAMGMLLGFGLALCFVVWLASPFDHGAGFTILTIVLPNKLPDFHVEHLS